MNKNLIAAAAVLALSLGSGVAHAQSLAEVRATVEKALQYNPEVTNRLHAWQAAQEQVAIAEGARGPRVDLIGDAGVGRSWYQGNNAADGSLTRAGINLSLNQLLWDAQGTRREIERTQHERLARYFEYREAVEATAAEAARALYDVYRHRRLVALAEESFVQHGQAAERIGSRVRAGVGRGVDLEQAMARVALSESNLTTEQSNLHDVTARYLRIVGELPPADDGSAQPTVLASAMPATAADAISLAASRSPAVSASIETLRAARAAVATREAAMGPRLEANARAGVGHNLGQSDGRRGDVNAGLTFTLPLIDGGIGQARVRQQQRLLQQTEDLRDKACRDARQTAAIAVNDALRSAEQIGHLERNTAAIDKAREAYRQQFDIGQRNLIDLLNSENEAYTARRSLANARFDRALAHVRTHAALYQLTPQLGVAPVDEPSEAQAWAAGMDAAARCPDLTVPFGQAGTAYLVPRVAATLPKTGDALPMPAPAAAAASAWGTGRPQAGALPVAPAGMSGMAGMAGMAGAKAKGLPHSPYRDGLGATAAPLAVGQTGQYRPGVVPPVGMAAALPGAAAAAAANTAAAAATAAAVPAELVDTLSARITQWAAAWQSRDFARYRSFYAPDFKGSMRSSSAWESARKAALERNDDITIQVGKATFVHDGAGSVRSRFPQHYSSKMVRDSMQKTLVWKQINGQWLIASESGR